MGQMAALIEGHIESEDRQERRAVAVMHRAINQAFGGGATGRGNDTDAGEFADVDAALAAWGMTEV